MEKLELVKKLAKELGVKKIVKTTVDKIAKKQSYYDGRDGCVSSESYTYYTVFYYDGKEISSVEVPEGRYRQGYADNHIQDIKEEKDIYVGDYLNDDAIAVLECSYDSEYDEDEEKVLYVLKKVDKQELKEEILKRVRRCNDL